jgi:hypothetical protein
MNSKINNNSNNNNICSVTDNNYDSCSINVSGHWIRLFEINVRMLSWDTYT